MDSWVQVWFYWGDPVNVPPPIHTLPLKSELDPGTLSQTQQIKQKQKPIYLKVTLEVGISLQMGRTLNLQEVNHHWKQKNASVLLTKNKSRSDAN